MSRRAFDPFEASAPQFDPTDFPDGSDRVLLFRGAKPPPLRKLGHRGDGDVDGRFCQRLAAGLVGIFYQGELVESLRALEEHALVEYGPGRYRVVVQRMSSGGWMYLTSTVRAIGAEIPPDDIREALWPEGVDVENSSEDELEILGRSARVEKKDTKG